MDADAALALCDEILEDLDLLPDRAAEFAEDARERVESMWDWIDSRRVVTGKMIETLENTRDAVKRLIDVD